MPLGLCSCCPICQEIVYSATQLSSDLCVSPNQNRFISWTPTAVYVGLFWGSFCIVLGLQDPCLSGPSIKLWVPCGRGLCLYVSVFRSGSPLLGSHQVSLDGVDPSQCVFYQMEVNRTIDTGKEKRRAQGEPWRQWSVWKAGVPEAASNECDVSRRARGCFPF